MSSGEKSNQENPRVTGGKKVETVEVKKAVNKEGHFPI
jgi:hypothetical protein